MSDGAGGTLITNQYRAATPVWSGAGADFDAAWYLAEYPSVATSGMDPLTQYLTVGWKEGYNPNPWFNTDYYLNQNPDVAAAGVNPLVHYEQNGWKEGRDPSILFSTNGYLAANPDVAAAGMDPLEHYLDYGQFEGRQPVAATPHDNVAQDPLVDGAWYVAPVSRRGRLRPRSDAILRPGRLEAGREPGPLVRHQVLPYGEPGRRRGRREPFAALRAVRLEGGA